MLAYWGVPYVKTDGLTEQTHGSRKDEIRMKSVIRSIPNILTVCRMADSITLLFFKPMTTAFILVYILCGLSDVLDGFLARMLNSESRYGAMLDSLADALFIFACLTKLLPFFHFPIWIWIWCAVVAVIKFSTLYIFYKGHRYFGFSSSRSNKMAGFVLFFAPLFGLAMDIQFVAVVVGTFTTYAAILEHRKARNWLVDDIYG